MEGVPQPAMCHPVRYSTDLLSPLSPHTNTPESLRDAGLRTASFGPRGTLADDSEAKGTPLTESECVCSREDKTPMYTISFLRRGLRKPSKQPFTHHCPVSCSSFSFWRWIRLHTREGNTMHVRPNHSRCQNLLSTYQLTPHPSPHTQHRTVTIRKTRLNFQTYTRTHLRASRKPLPEESDFRTSSETPRFLTNSLILLGALHPETYWRRNSHPHHILNNALQ